MEPGNTSDVISRVVRKYEAPMGGRIEKKGKLTEAESEGTKDREFIPNRNHPRVNSHIPEVLLTWMANTGDF